MRVARDTRPGTQTKSVQAGRGGPGARGLRIAALALLLAVPALAEWLAPDASFRDAQLQLRAATRDTTGHGDDRGRLDTLGVALLAVNRLAEARTVFERARAMDPSDAAAGAGLGKLALFEDRLDEAERLLAPLGTGDDQVAADLFATRVRRGEWAGAAELAPRAGQAGRVALLEALAVEGAYTQAAAPAGTIELPWVRAHPVPLVRAKLNGQSVLLAISTGVGDLLLDAPTARRCRVRTFPAEAPTYWSGTRVAGRMALVQTLELGGLRLQHVPAAAISLRKYSLNVNPQSETIGGVIGFGLLRRFTPTLDWKRQRLELAPAGAAPAAGAEARRVPIRIWGESHVTVEGTIGGGRSMAMFVDTGIPEAAVGAPREVFEELGIKPGPISRMMRGAGVWLNGQPWSAVGVPAVTVGAVSRDRCDGWSGALDPAEMWRHGVRRDALLSGEFFRGMRVTFDWSARELVVDTPR